MEYTAPNGAVWTRRPGGTSTVPQLVRTLEDFTLMHNVERTWNWWEPGRRDREYEEVWAVLEEWDNQADRDQQRGDEDVERIHQAFEEDVERRLAEDKAHRAELVASSYDEKLEDLRLVLLRRESDIAFFAHVLEQPASPVQRDDAERRMAESSSEAADLRAAVGDPEAVIDRFGRYPAERRAMHLDSHLNHWRYPKLREYAGKDRRRFNALLKMPPLTTDELCSECEAPTKWHEYDLSLRLFQGSPPSGSPAETITLLMPGWWQRCPACTAYAIGHRWGGTFALPDFTADQWQDMLPPMLRVIFTSAPPRNRRVKPTRKNAPKPLKTIPAGPINDVMAQLAEIQSEYPDAQVRPGKEGTWQVWPS